MRAHFLENFKAASFASVPELAKKTLSANELSTSLLANFTCKKVFKIGFWFVDLDLERILTSCHACLLQSVKLFTCLRDCVKQIARVSQCGSLLI